MCCRSPVSALVSCVQFVQLLGIPECDAEQLLLLPGLDTRAFALRAWFRAMLRTQKAEAGGPSGPLGAHPSARRGLVGTEAHNRGPAPRWRQGQREGLPGVSRARTRATASTSSAQGSATKNTMVN